MIVELIECHRPSGDGFVAGALFENSVRVHSDERSQRIDELQKEGLEPAVLDEFCPDMSDLLEPSGGQVRLTLIDVAERDTTVLARWLEAVFGTDAHIWSLGSQGSGWDALAGFLVAGADEDPMFMVSSSARTTRVQIARLTVPTLIIEESGADPRQTLGERQLVLFVVGGFVLDLWLRADTSSKASQDPADSLGGSLAWASRSSYSSGADGRAPGDIANCLVRAVITRYSETVRAVDGELERWETDFFAVAAANRRFSTSDEPLFDARRISELRSLTASLRDGVDGIERFVLRGTFSTWLDTADTPVDPPEIGGPLVALRESLAEQRELAQEALGLVAGTSAAALLGIAQESQRRSDSLQAAITFITAFLLVPGLLAALYASGIAVPGGSNANHKARWLGGIMLFGSSSTVVLLRLYTTERKKWALVLGAMAVLTLVGVFAIWGNPPSYFPQK